MQIFVLFSFRENAAESIDVEESLCIEPAVENLDFAITGRRIVDIAYFINSLQQFQHFGPFNCSFKEVQVTAERKIGLCSKISLKCRMCRAENHVYTEDPASDKLRINTSAVIGIMSIGGGFSNMEEFLSALDIPCMSSKTFSKVHRIVAEAWEKTATAEMASAAEEEKRMAVGRGDVDCNGIPLLTVVVDGTWGKRSYRTNYSSLSGAVSIISFTSYVFSFPKLYSKTICILCDHTAFYEEEREGGGENKAQIN